MSPCSHIKWRGGKSHQLKSWNFSEYLDYWFFFLKEGAENQNFYDSKNFDAEKNWFQKNLRQKHLVPKKIDSKNYDVKKKLLSRLQAEESMDSEKRKQYELKLWTLVYSKIKKISFFLRLPLPFMILPHPIKFQRF